MDTMVTKITGVITLTTNNIISHHKCYISKKLTGLNKIDKEIIPR